jgi:hypothetical protein
MLGEPSFEKPHCGGELTDDAIEVPRWRAGLGRRRGLILRLIMSGLSFPSWH